MMKALPSHSERAKRKHSLTNRTRFLTLSNFDSSYQNNFSTGSTGHSMVSLRRKPVEIAAVNTDSHKAH